MCTRGVVIGVVTLLAVGAATRPIHGQAPSGETLPVPGSEGLRPAQLLQLFDAMLVMQAQNALSLNDEQHGQFLSRLRALQQTRRRNQQERARLVNELQRLTNPRNTVAASESDLKLRLNALQELESRAAAEVRRAYNGVDEVLSPLQQARFRVLEEQIERQKLNLIGRARQNNQNRPTVPRRPPPH